MAAPFQVRKDYRYNLCASSVLFAGTGLHLESTSVRKQFNDNAYIGTNTDGNLLHDDTKDFTGKSNYLVKQEVANNSVYAHIIFYRSVPTQPYAEFIGLDPRNTITYLNMNGYTATSGQWTDFSSTTSAGKVERKSGQLTVTCTFDKKQATITLRPDSSFPQNISVKGDFTYIGGEDFATKAVNANWNQDHIVFYQGDRFIDTNWVCFFAPEDGYKLPKEGGIGSTKSVSIDGDGLSFVLRSGRL